MSEARSGESPAGESPVGEARAGEVPSGEAPSGEASAGAQGATAVSLRQLSKSYGRDRAVDRVDLDVAPGTMTALLGPSGCGKTTTLKLVAGLLKPDHGEVTFDGAPMGGVAVERRPVSMVFQKALLFPNMSVGGNVGFGLRMRGTSRQEVVRRVSDMLELVRLPGLADRRVGELSGGQEQRVALARALVTEPKVLLLDEPLSQLDAGLRVEMRELIRRVQREVGVTSVFVTHDQEEAVTLADRIALMLDGRIEQYDQPRAFYDRPASLRAARFFGGLNSFAGILADGVFDSPVGRLAVADQHRSGPGILVIRQEALRLVSRPGPNVVTARVSDVRYLGTHLALQACHGSVVLHLTAAPSSVAEVGDEVSVHLPPQACAIVAPDSGCG